MRIELPEPDGTIINVNFDLVKIVRPSDPDDDFSVIQFIDGTEVVAATPFKKLVTLIR